jgi:hypothetical protein
MSTVSVTATVRNERASIQEVLHGLLAQSQPPDEIVIVDGGSTDGTAEWLDEAATRHPTVAVYHARGTSISQGRNIAIRHARGPIIAVTDGGTRAASDWLERLVAPLEEDPELAVASGFYQAAGDTFFERCLSTIITPQAPEIDPISFLPSSRSVAFRKAWWERVGGYPEWLRHCEDLVFDLDLRRQGARMQFVPEAIVTWRARRTLRAFACQYFDYARGDGHALLWPGRHAARYAAYTAGLLLLGATSVVPWAGLILAGGIGGHLAKPYRRVLRKPPAVGLVEALATVLLVPLIVATGDLAKMAGYPAGRLERWYAGGPSGLLARLRPPPARTESESVPGQAGH